MKQLLLRRLYIIYSTLYSTLKSRNYILPNLPKTQTEFDNAFGRNHLLCREDLTFFATKSNGNSVGIYFISSPEKKAISIQHVRNIISRLRFQQIKHGI